MNKKLKHVLSLSLCSALLVTACSTSNKDTGNNTDSSGTENIQEQDNASSDNVSTKTAYPELVFDNNTWSYDQAVNCYYQIGIPYCTNPETQDYETLAIYVPGEYMDGTDNEDGTYSCTIKSDGTVNGFSVETAPVAIPVKTPGYMSMPSQKEYDYEEARPYVNAGFIYVHAGCRGRNNGTDDNDNFLFSGGAPWGVTDLKAAIRYLRYNSTSIPGDTDSIYTFGMSGGGAQSALMGATGNSSLYTPYLESIGAAMSDDNSNPISDAITGAMCWCPVTSLDVADKAYEWNMGQYDSLGLRAKNSWGAAMSDDLSQLFAEYINDMAFKDEDGNILSLEETKHGIYTAGSYYNYLMKVINTSLNNYISDNNLDEKYIKKLNKEAGNKWITYNKVDKTATVKDMESFVLNWKKATKKVGAFDDLSGLQPENHLFGNDENDAVHFNIEMAELLTSNEDKYSKLDEWNNDYVTAYQEGIKTIDKLGNDIQTRMDMYNPLYFLSDKMDGYGTSETAKYWRINTGIMQGDTSLTTETNLYLTLSQMDNTDVSFTTVWDQPHVEAERTGDFTENFIDWIFQCQDNTTKRIERESGTGTPSNVASEDNSNKGTTSYTIADGYDLCETFDHFFDSMNQNITIFASITEDKTKMNLQFDFFEDKQDVTLEYTKNAWVVTEDKSGFMSQDGPVIATEAMEKDEWTTPSSETGDISYEPAPGYEMYAVIEYNFESINETIPIMASTNTVQTRMNLQFDFFEDKQDVTLEYTDGTWIVTEDKSGFMSQDGPLIAAYAVEQDAWIIK